MTDADILRVLVVIDEDNRSRIYPDPNGSHPRCKPALRSCLCERCGNDVNEMAFAACPSIPPDQRWSIHWDSPQPITL